MALSDHARLPYQIRYIRAYLASRNANNTYNAWQDVSRYVVDANLGQSTKSIDTNDFDIGFYEESNQQIAFDNSYGDFMEGQGFFQNAIVDRSKVKIVAGYQDIESLQPEYQVTFEGIIDDRGTSIDTTQENCVFTVLAYSSIFKRLLADPGAVTNGQTFQQALFNLMNRGDVSNLLTIDINNINPQVNLTIDNSDWFAGQQLDSAINGLLLAGNSVLKITDNTVYISGRTESSTVRFQFFGKGSAKPANIVSIQDYNNGLRRQFSQVQVNNITFDAADDIMNLYGADLKQIDVSFINDPDAISAIVKNILNEFQYPKAELMLTTDFLGSEIDILDMVTIDNEGFIEDAQPAFYGMAVYGQSQYVTRQGGVKIRGIEGFKVLSVTHDYKAYTSTYKLRLVGNQPYDSNAGYSNPIYGQAVYGLSRYSRSGVSGGGGGGGGAGGGTVTPVILPEPGAPIGLFLTLTVPTPVIPPVHGSPIGLFLTITNP